MLMMMGQCPIYHPESISSASPGANVVFAIITVFSLWILESLQLGTIELSESIFFLLQFL